MLQTGAIEALSTDIRTVGPFHPGQQEFRILFMIRARGLKYDGRQANIDASKVATLLEKQKKHRGTCEQNSHQGAEFEDSLRRDSTKFGAETKFLDRAKLLLQGATASNR